MHDNLAVTRAGLHMALAYSLPLMVWLVGQSMLVSAGQAAPESSLRLLLGTLVLVQAGALVVCLPWLLRYPSRSGHGAAALMLLLVPLPVYMIIWLAGAADAGALLKVLVCLSVFGLGLYGLYSVCLALSRSGHTRSLLLLCLQLLVLVSCWNYRADWQQWLGL